MGFRMRALAGVVIVGLGLLAAWPADAFEHRCPEPGTEVWTTEIPASSRPVIYEGQNGLWCLRSRGGQPINSELGHFRFRARNARTSDLFEKFDAAASALWPLYPGKRATFQFLGARAGSGEAADTSSQFYSIDITVDMQRQITVPAGTFSVVPIVVTQRGEKSGSYEGSETYYYSPELGTNVKFEFRLISGSILSPPKSWELARIRSPASDGSDGSGGGGPAR